MSSRPMNAQSCHAHRPLHVSEPEDGEALPSTAVTRPREFAVPTSQHEVTPGLTWYLPLKRTADMALAVVLLALSGPIVLVGALLVRLTSRGPAFYRQVRVGIGGRPFTL